MLLRKIIRSKKIKIYVTKKKVDGVGMELIVNRKLINLGGLIKDVRKNNDTW